MANFLSMSAEIRSMIYKEVIKTTDTFKILPKYEQGGKVLKTVTHPFSNVCKQIKSEFTPMWNHWGPRQCTITTIIHDCHFEQFYNYLKTIQDANPNPKQVREIAIYLRQTKIAYSPRDWLQTSIWTDLAISGQGLYIDINGQYYEVQYRADARTHPRGAMIKADSVKPFSEKKLIYEYEIDGMEDAAGSDHVFAMRDVIGFNQYRLCGGIRYRFLKKPHNVVGAGQVEGQF